MSKNDLSTETFHRKEFSVGFALQSTVKEQVACLLRSVKKESLIKCPSTKVLKMIPEKSCHPAAAPPASSSASQRGAPCPLGC